MHLKNLHGGELFHRSSHLLDSCSRFRNVSLYVPGQMARKNPPFSAGFALLWTTLDGVLVEAGGIEPPSGNIPLQVLRT